MMSGFAEVAPSPSRPPPRPTPYGGAQSAQPKGGQGHRSSNCPPRRAFVGLSIPTGLSAGTACCPASVPVLVAAESAQTRRHTTPFAALVTRPVSSLGTAGARRLFRLAGD